ncbi:MAG: NCS2 family permease [Deltaproteobacteria bacterium]|jgi:AGZA family xanthine/uracil permease-like MFS transporter|nr:NCS2 family permease [Deltaproteobacteria bacterium]
MSKQLAGLSSVLEKIFQLRAKEATVRTELIAGLTTFVTMSYILFVNPNILAAAGIPKDAAIAATIWSAVFSTVLMGLWANFPIAVAPGMGLNAFFAYTVVLGMGLPWQTALGAVFISGLVFLVLTCGGIRQAIIRAVPANLKCAIGVGIGLFIAFVGLQGSGIIVGDPATLVTAGPVAGISFEFGRPAPLLTLAGLIFTGALMARQVRAALLLGIAFTTVLGMFCGAAPVPGGISDLLGADTPSLSETFLAMDIAGAWEYGIFSIIFTFTVVELFDNMGTLMGLARKAKLLKDDGSMENLDRALTSDAVGTMASAALGTSTVTSYVESGAGIAAGGRTGLTALTVAALFALALFFAPLFKFVPGFATAPALILVGALMMSDVVQVRFEDITETLPAFLTIIMMPLTYSIANGLAFGFVSHSLLKIFSGKARELNPVMALISLAFMLNFVLRLA